MRRFLILILLFLTTPTGSSFASDNPLPFLWSGFSTSLQGRSPQQRHNAALAARFIDGFIIPPGGIFSFNELVGARNRAKGYDAAPFLNGNGLLEETAGGGICQLASTIYNAGLLGGMVVIERHPHSRIVRHVPPGRDATIASWVKDLRLRNPFSHPLQIRISSDNDRLTVALRSPAEKPFDVEIITEQVPLEPQAVAGRGKKRQAGAIGYSTATWRIIKRDGMERKELLSEDSYPAPSRILTGGEK